VVLTPSAVVSVFGHDHAPGPRPDFRLGVVAATISALAAEPASPEAEIRGTLMRWMEDFNASRVDKVCDIFAPGLIADNQGVPERDYDAQCKLLHGVLVDGERSFCYALDLKEIIAEGDMAAARLVWTLTRVISRAPQCGHSSSHMQDHSSAHRRLHRSHLQWLRNQAMRVC
jgi:hypothetical protein